MQKYSELAYHEKILELLSSTDEPLCATDVSKKLDIPLSSATHILFALKKEHVLRAEKKGKSVIYYFMNDELKNQFNNTLNNLKEAYVKSLEIYKRELAFDNKQNNDD